jgi:hypothetical protein
MRGELVELNWNKWQVLRRKGMGQENSGKGSQRNFV